MVRLIPRMTAAAPAAALFLASDSVKVSTVDSHDGDFFDSSDRFLKVNR